MSEKLFKRVLEGKCPVCKKELKAEETVILQYNKSKLEVHKKHIKYKEA